MRTMIKIFVLIFIIWLINHPNTQALIKGVRSVTVDAPLEKAKHDFRKSAEEHARKEAEARMKKIDKAIEKIEQGNAP